MWIDHSDSLMIRGQLGNGSAPMGITYVFAGLVVTNRNQAAAWYERLLGRPPDFLPNDAEAVWQVAGTASVYLLADADRAGRGVLTLVVDDLGASLAEIAGRGIVTGAIEEIPGAGRKAVMTDPDGNAVSIVEILATPWQRIPLSQDQCAGFMVVEAVQVVERVEDAPWVPDQEERQGSRIEVGERLGRFGTFCDGRSVSRHIENRT
jgi:predicted enzyme related to lactoylglutathione lyase